MWVETPAIRQASSTRRCSAAHRRNFWCAIRGAANSQRRGNARTGGVDPDQYSGHNSCGSPTRGAGEFCRMALLVKALGSSPSAIPSPATAKTAHCNATRLTAAASASRTRVCAFKADNNRYRDVTARGSGPLCPCQRVRPSPDEYVEPLDRYSRRSSNSICARASISMGGKPVVEEEHRRIPQSRSCCGDGTACQRRFAFLSDAHQSGRLDGPGCHPSKIVNYLTTNFTEPQIGNITLGDVAIALFPQEEQAGTRVMLLASPQYSDVRSPCWGDPSTGVAFAMLRRNAAEEWSSSYQQHHSRSH